MHLSEFKAWFEGFTEDMDGRPNEKQWTKIQKRVKEITADYTPTPVFIEKYVLPYYPYYPHWSSGIALCQNTSNAQAIAQTASANQRANDGGTLLSAWSDAGRAEYKSMSA